MNRKKLFVLNTTTGIIKQIVALICGFILPRFMILYFGSSVNGLVASITNFLGFVSLLDLGVGAVIQANLYKPLAERNYEQVSRIVSSSKKFFRNITLIFFVYLIALIVVFPSTYKEYDALFTISLLIIIGISTVSQYLLGMTNQLLLTADQKVYIPLTLHIGTLILNTIISIILMKLGASIHTVKLSTTIIFVLRPVIQSIIVHKLYPIDETVKYTEEPIKQKWNGFSQHLAAVVCQNIDIVVLTYFSTLEYVSVYSVYYLVISGVQQIIMTAATGLEALFGNMIAKNEYQRLNEVFDITEWIIHAGVTIVFSITAITIVPFVMVYTTGIQDANYYAPLFGLLLTIAYAFQCLRIPYFRVIKAAGHFKQTQNGAYISAGLNIVVTVSLVYKFNLVGAAVGTLIAMLYHTCYFVWYLRNCILNRNVSIFVKNIFSDIIVFSLSVLATGFLHMEIHNYYQWVVYAFLVAIIVIGISFAVQMVTNRHHIVRAKGMLLNIIKR